MIKVASLVGVSYSGKSTLAEGLVDSLAEKGITADIIKKDDALREVGKVRFGEEDKTGGYSILGALKGKKIASADLHSWMNKRVGQSLAVGHTVILEGGTRTRTAQAETLHGLELDDDEVRLFLMQLPFKEVINRARQRRKQLHRYDDRLPVALAKLHGQYSGLRSDDAPQLGDPDVQVLDAALPTARLIEIVENEILDSREEVE